MAEKIYDLVVFGATGFTGRLISEYLVRNAPASAITRWALAGRNPDKLRSIANSLPKGEIPVPDIIQADTSFQLSLIEMTRKTRVVISTVGPYSRFGEGLVKACIETGTDYLDLTGEPVFVKNMEARYGEQAVKKGVLIINCCGFDSIPADLGAYLAVSALPQNEEKTVLAYVSTNGRPSGGTWASLLTIMSEAGINDSEFSFGHLPPDKRGIHRTEAGWAIPMPVIDLQVVKKSSHNRMEYGPGFSYGQFFMVKDFPGVLGTLTGAGLLFLGSKIPLTREVLQRLIQSGEGPSEERRTESTFELTFDASSASGRARVSVSGGDPGYTETSKMISECALLLLSKKLKPDRTLGITTPVSVFGQELKPALERAGIRFSVRT